MRKFLLSFFSMIVIFSIIAIGNASAEEGITIVAEHEVEGDSNATVDFVDKEKMKSGKRAKPKGGPQDAGTYATVYEQYSHSTYTWYTSNITSYNSGPLNNNKFLLSVARGQTKTLTHSVGISGTVSYGVSVGADLKKVINLGLTSSATGTIDYTYNTSTSYSGPDSPYNTRDYYGAIQYDTHSTQVKKYDVYNQYNGSTKTGTNTYYVGIVTTNSVKKPKAITYSKDFTN